MRLIQARNLDLVEFIENEIPPYAILSHTWEDEEVSFEEMGHRHRAIGKTRSWAKIEKTCEQAIRDGLDYAWVDTCCINKSSSAELSESINSMFRWYEKSKVCYSFLVDVPHRLNWHHTNAHESFSASRWFTRGWTLQELIAPPNMVFYDSAWSVIGTRDQMTDIISAITGIEQSILSVSRPMSMETTLSPQPTDTPKLWDMLDDAKDTVIQGESLSTRLARASVAERMSWASKRKTTRTEDIAYCLLGIFGVNMPLIYGEGTAAFVRLQEEILKQSNDYSILAWNFTLKGKPLPVSTWEASGSFLGFFGGGRKLRAFTTSKMGPDCPPAGLLAESPVSFQGCSDIIPCEVDSIGQPPVLTQKGLYVTLPLSEDEPPYVLLPCRTKADPFYIIAIPLLKLNGNVYARAKWPHKMVSCGLWHRWFQASMYLLVHTRFLDTRTGYSDYSFCIRDLTERYRVVGAYPKGSWSESAQKLVLDTRLEKGAMGATAQGLLHLHDQEGGEDLCVVLEAQRLYQNGVCGLKPVMTKYKIIPYPVGQALSSPAAECFRNLPGEPFQYHLVDNGLVFLEIKERFVLGRPVFSVEVKLESHARSAPWKQLGFDVRTCLVGRFDDAVKCHRWLAVLSHQFKTFAGQWEQVLNVYLRGLMWTAITLHLPPLRNIDKYFMRTSLFLEEIIYHSFAPIILMSFGFIGFNAIVPYLPKFHAYSFWTSWGLFWVLQMFGAYNLFMVFMVLGVDILQGIVAAAGLHLLFVVTILLASWLMAGVHLFAC